MSQSLTPRPPEAIPDPCEQRPIPLDQVRPHQEVVLAQIDGGCGLRHRLTEMGLRAGVRFAVINRGGCGPIILAIGDSRLVLGQGMASRVMVYPQT